MPRSAVDYVLTGEAQSVIAELRKISQQLGRNEAQMRRVAQTSRQSKQQAADAGKAGANSFRQMGQAAMAAVGMVGGLTKAFSDLQTAQANAAAKARESVTETGKLAQLAAGQPEYYKWLMGRVEASMEEVGMSRTMAAQMQFALESLGLQQHRRMFAGLYGVADPLQLAEGIGTFQAAFGKREAGGAREILNKLLAASGVTKPTIAQLAPAAAMAAPSFQQIGATDEELLATLAIVSRTTPTADVAATQLRALADVMAQKGIEDQGFIAGLRQLEAQTAGMTCAERITYFGRKEARMGFANVMQSLGDVEETMRIVSEGEKLTGTSKDLTTGAMMAFLSDRENRRIRQADIMARQAEIRERETGMADLGLQKEMYRSQLQSYMADKNAIQRILGKGLAEAGMMFFDEIPEYGTKDDQLYNSVRRGVQDGSRNEALKNPDRE